MTEAEKLIELLVKRKEQVTTAESFTGGMLASSLIDVPGASFAIERAYVVYSDKVKTEELGVSSKTLEKFTAVSRETCEEMLKGLQKKTHCALCLASTGYAGPGGSDDGHCFLGVLYRDQIRVREFHFTGGRNEVRRRGVQEALDLGLLLLEEESHV